MRMFPTQITRRTAVIWWLILVNLLLLSYSYRHLPKQSLLYTNPKLWHNLHLLKDSNIKEREKQIPAVSTGTDQAGTIDKIPQVLEFMDPSTNTKIVLIGSMHYNPVSIQLAKDVIRKYANSKQLQSIVVESCPLRWKNQLTNNTFDLEGKFIQKELYFKADDTTDDKLDNSKGIKVLNSLLKQILYNEMVAAKDIALEYKIPIILGDQLINVTNSRIKENFQGTISDLLTPLSGGWKRLVNDVATSAMLSIPLGNQYLGTKDFFDPKLMASLPVTLVKYPLALMIRSPVSILPLILILSATVFGHVNSATSATATDILIPNPVVDDANLLVLEQIQDYALSFLAFLSELVLFSRVFLIAILQERNEIIAKSILIQCKNVNKGVKSSISKDSKIATPKKANVLKATTNERSNVLEKVSDYMKDTFKKVWEKISDDIEDEEELKMKAIQKGKPKVIVAVLGMAHCNGIKKLIEERRITA